MIFILFGILQLPMKTINYIIRFDTAKECITARKELEVKYGLNNFAGFCTKEVIK